MALDSNLSSDLVASFLSILILWIYHSFLSVIMVLEYNLIRVMRQRDSVFFLFLFSLCCNMFEWRHTNWDLISFLPKNIFYDLAKWTFVSRLWYGDQVTIYLKLYLFLSQISQAESFERSGKFYEAKKFLKSCFENFKCSLHTSSKLVEEPPVFERIPLIFYGWYVGLLFA